MKDFLLHEFLKMGPIGMLFLVIGAFFIGAFLVIIIKLNKSPVNWIESDVKPWRRKVVIGYRGSVPIYGLMYSERFVRFIYGRLKGCWAKREAIKQVTGGK